MQDIANLTKAISDAFIDPSGVVFVAATRQAMALRMVPSPLLDRSGDHGGGTARQDGDRRGARPAFSSATTAGPRSTAAKTLCSIPRTPRRCRWSVSAALSQRRRGRCFKQTSSACAAAPAALGAPIPAPSKSSKEQTGHDQQQRTRRPPNSRRGARAARGAARASTFPGPYVADDPEAPEPFVPAPARRQRFDTRQQPEPGPDWSQWEIWLETRLNAALAIQREEICEVMAASHRRRA